MLLHFTKMHGLGNDFMVVDLVTQRARLRDEQIRQLADRRFGIGFDQLLIVEPPRDPDMDFRYRIYNAAQSKLPSDITRSDDTLAICQITSQCSIHQLTCHKKS